MKELLVNPDKLHYWKTLVKPVIQTGMHFTKVMTPRWIFPATPGTKNI